MLRTKSIYIYIYIHDHSTVFDLFFFLLEWNYRSFLRLSKEGKGLNFTWDQSKFQWSVITGRAITERTYIFSFDFVQCFTNFVTQDFVDLKKKKTSIFLITCITNEGKDRIPFPSKCRFLEKFILPKTKSYDHFYELSRREATFILSSVM